MGRCYNLTNHSKQQVVEAYYYWKGTPFCNCHEVMHQLQWDKNDEITSFACYRDEFFDEEFIKIDYNKDTNEMEWNRNDIYKNHSELDSFAHYSFDCNFFDNKDEYNHIPIWNGNQCIVCGYIYHEEKLKQYSKEMDKINMYKDVFG